MHCLGPDGPVIESAISRMISRGEFEMQKATPEMDWHGGTDFVVICDDYKVALGVTLCADITRSNKSEKCDTDCEKFAYWARSHRILDLYANIHIQLVLCERDPLDWDNVLKAGLKKVDELACDYESTNDGSWGSWKAGFKQIVVKATKKGVTVTIKDYSL